MSAPATPGGAGASAGAKAYAEAPPPFLLRPFTDVWRAQFGALVVRALYMIRFRVASSLAVVFLPAVFVGLLLALSNAVAAVTAPPVGLQLSRCTAFNVYSYPYKPGRACVTVLFAPNDAAPFTEVMQRVAAATGLQYGVDVVGVASASAAAQLLFDDPYRQYDAAVVFNPNATLLAIGEASYEIWYNRSLPVAYARNGLDALWRATGVSGRHAALQKEVDAAIVARLAGASGTSGVPTLDATVAAFPDTEAANALGAGSDGLQIIAAATFVCAGVVAGALFAMMLVTGEKGRRLVGQLRTIGLYESTYWVSPPSSTEPPS